MHVAVTAVVFCAGIGVGVVLATACLVFASLYDDHVEDKKRRKK